MNNHNELTLEIQPDDFDRYGHLNNARYPLYFEQGRDALTKDMSVHSDTLALQNQGIFVKSASYDYTHPIGPEVKQVCIQSRFEYTKGSTINIVQEMYVADKLVATATAVCCFMDTVRNKPIRPLEELLAKIR